MIKIEPFTGSAFDPFISWIEGPELLIAIAGNYFSYPVTHGQLYKYLNDKNSIADKTRWGTIKFRSLATPPVQFLSTRLL